jgi:hypothetical protein
MILKEEIKKCNLECSEEGGRRKLVQVLRKL